MPLVEVGTGSKSIEIVSIDQTDVSVVGGVVDGVAVRVGKIQLKSADAVAHRSFESMVNVRRRLLFAGDTANAVIGTERISDGATSSDSKVNGRTKGKAVRSYLVRNGYAARSCAVGGDAVGVGCGAAICSAHRLTRLVGILRKRDRLELVQCELASEMDSRAADIRQRCHRVSGDVVLNVQMPLLHIGPDRFVGNGNETQGRGGCSQSRWVDICVTYCVEEGSSLREGGVLLQLPGVGFALVGVFVEDAISAPNGPLSVALGIESEPNTRSRVKEMSLHASVGDSCCDSALNPTVVRIASDEVRGVRTAGARNVMTRIEVPGAVVDLTVRTVKAHAQTQVEGQALGGVPVVLEIWLEDFVSVVGFDSRFFLLKDRDVAQKQIGEGVPAGNSGVARIE